MIRRFYKEASVAEVSGGWQVMLDARGMKTVGGRPQIVPSRALAEALAEEWAQQGEKIDPKTLPLRDMADYALDVVAAQPGELAAQLTAYADTDTLCYRADPDEPLHARQWEVWEPLVADFEARSGFKLVRVSGIVHRPQDAAVLAALAQRLAGENSFVLAGLEVMTRLTASLVTALLALEAADEARALALWQAACLEEEWQADLWGRDWEAEERRAARKADFLRAWRFVQAARGG
ncbi:MAG: ATP12 family chaperone protein [Erythrobacter sp.]